MGSQCFAIQGRKRWHDDRDSLFYWRYSQWFWLLAVLAMTKEPTRLKTVEVLQPQKTVEALQPLKPR